MFKNNWMTDITSHNAVYQSVLAFALAVIIPLLSIIYMGSLLLFHSDLLSVYITITLLITTVLISAGGCMIFFKFPVNIIRLRRYISEVAAGLLPREISLTNSDRSNDLKFIEQGLRTVIRQMQVKINTAERQRQVEHDLMEQILRQQNTLLHAERHRVMVQSLAAACHHLRQPATVLQMRLHVMRHIHIATEEDVQLEECEKNLNAIMDILDRLMQVSEFRTESYVDEDSGEQQKRLAL